MVRIRFRRVGAKNQPSFRIVAADKESPRDGRFLENLGHYNPRTEPSTVVVDEARLFHWLQHGAQPSDSVRKTLKPLGTWDRWERFKAGEDLETLLEEAKANKIDVDPRTRRDDLFSERSAKKAAVKKEKAAEEGLEEEPAEVEEIKAEVPEEEPEAVEETEEEPTEVAVEEVEASEDTETPSEPEPEQEEPEATTEEAPEEATEETSEGEEADAGEEDSSPAEDDEVEASEEEAEESSEDNEQENSEE